MSSFRVMHPNFRTPNTPAARWVRCGGLAALLWLTQPRAARAEDSLTYKYQSWQEDNGRVHVNSHYALAEEDLNPDTHLKVMGLIDAIAGATPTGELPKAPGDPTPEAHMQDLRHAISTDLSHQFKGVSVDLGYAFSKESDYISNGWSVNTVTDFNQKNTELLLGYGRTDDVIEEPKLGWTINRHKHGNDFIAGLTQVLDPNTSATFNVSYGRSRGFQADPYKIVSTTMLDLDPGTYYTPPENRPDFKNKLSLFVGLNRNFDSLHGALDASYRYYHDSYGIVSHTTTLIWVQDLGEHFQLQPLIRFMRQSAADFYYYNLDQSGIVTSFEPVLGETGTGRKPYYSSDYRLSYLQTVDAGLKLTWKIKSWVAVDVAYDRYVMRGLDHITPQDAYTKANNFTVGIKFTH